MTETGERNLDLSVVIPVYNEEDNVAPLVEDVLREVSALGLSFEVILVNDGSTDGSADRLDAAAGATPAVKVIHFAHNCGQTLALAAGMHESRGKTIVCLDGDRQNDPADIGRLLGKLDEGYDCVSGWRKARKDAGLRRMVSQAANYIVKRLTGVPIHDLGCTLKAYRAGAVDPLELFGEMHRFLAVHVMARGGRIAELEVQHHRRTAGVGKYGMGRIPRVVADLLLIHALFKYRTRPSHLLAKMAQAMAVTGGVLWLASIVLQVGFKWPLGQLGFLSFLILAAGACVVLAVGVCCELVMRNRYRLSGRVPWVICRRVNLESPAGAAPAHRPSAGANPPKP